MDRGPRVRWMVAGLALFVGAAGALLTFRRKQSDPNPRDASPPAPHPMAVAIPPREGASFGSPGPIERRKRRSRLRIYVPSLVLFLTTCFSVWGTWMLIPPDRTLNQPLRGLEITLNSNQEIESAQVLLRRFDKNRWLIGVGFSSKAGSVGNESETLSSEVVQATIRGLQLAPCEGFEYAVQVKACERNGAKEVEYKYVGRVIEAEAGWIGARLPQESGGGVSGSNVGVSIMVYDSPLIGVATNSGGSRIALPTLTVMGAPKNPTDTVDVVTTVGIEDAYRQEWSGITPVDVEQNAVEWRYTADRNAPGQVMVQGTNRSAIDRDQRLIFAAGILAGLAGGAAIATIEHLLSTRNPRLG